MRNRIVPAGSATFGSSDTRNSARIYLEAEKRAGVWNFEYLVVEIGGSGERIDLLGLPENWIQTMRMRRQDPRPNSVFGQTWDGPLVLPVLTEHRRFAKLTGSDHRRRTPVAPNTLRGEA